MKLFSQIDFNSDGYISHKEFKDATGLNHNDLTLLKIMTNLDIEKNGGLSFAEFQAATVRSEVLKDQTKVKIAFEIFDENGDGAIDEKDLSSFLKVDLMKEKLLL